MPTDNTSSLMPELFQFTTEELSLASPETIATICPPKSSRNSLLSNSNTSSEASSIISDVVRHGEGNHNYLTNNNHTSGDCMNTTISNNHPSINEQLHIPS